MVVASALDGLLISAEQVAHYQRDGWVKLPGLISAEIAADMLRVARGCEASEAEVSDRGPAVRDLAMWREWRFIARDAGAQPFASIAFHPEIGRVVTRLEGHGGGVRYWTDVVSRKAPAGRTGGAATSWHQDLPAHPIDRLGGATVWIALDDVAADQGAMHFLSGSHRAGPLGRTYSSGTRTDGLDVLATYPWLLDEYDSSGPVALKAGDVTVHHPLVVHGSSENTTDRDRWSFIVMYVAENAVYTGSSYSGTDGLGLPVDQPLDHPLFPVVYSTKTPQIA